MNEDSAIAIEDEGMHAPSSSPSSPEPLASIAHVALPPGVSKIDFDAVLAIGRDKGQLTEAQLIEALHAVELTPEVLMILIDRVTAEGVALVEDEEEDLLVEIAPRQGQPVPATGQRDLQARAAP